MTTENQNEEPSQERLDQRSLSIGGNVDNSPIVVGDRNTIHQGPTSYHTTNVFNPINVAPATSAPSQSLSKQEYRWRQVLVDNVRHYWIEGVLERSLHNQALIELGLEERSKAVASPLRGVGEFPDEPSRALPEGTQATDIFDGLGEGRTLLILGEPGAGKTTTLLKLAQSLLERIGDDLSQPIPVILNLSSWAKKRQPIAEWLVQDLYETFQVSRLMGKVWIQEEQLILCLDGLDEVEVSYRNDCVQALNQFIQAHGRTEMVVCSRVKDYEALSERLRLRSAIYVQPLTLQQVDDYLAQAGEQLAALKTVLNRNSDAKEFASSPLILSVMSLAYKGCLLEQFPNPASPEVFLQRLFEAYIERMFQRRGPTCQYSHMQTRYWLVWIARRMIQTSQTVFLIERIQPSWLQTKIQRLCYWVVSTLGITLKITLGVPIILTSVLLLTSPNPEIFRGLVSTLIWIAFHGFITAAMWGAISGVSAVLSERSRISFLKDIETVETLRWSWREAKKSSRSGLNIVLGFVLIFGLLFGLATGLGVFGVGGFAREIWINQTGIDVIVKVFLFPFVVLLSGLSISLVSGIVIGSFTILITGLLGGFKGPEVQKRGKPNQGVWLSFRNALVLTLSIGVAGGTITGLFTLAINLR